MDGAELTESVMARKVAELTNRQRQKERARSKSFSFTQQLTQDEVAPLADLPDNFDILATPAMAGSYFRNHRPEALQQQQAGPKTDVEAPSQEPRITPYQRNEMLDEQVHARMLQSLAEQEEDDRRRKEACAVQREVERLKMQQRTRARIELQLAASQRPVDRSVAEMGIDVNQILAEKPKSATGTSQHRTAVREQANAAFVKYNMTRMQYNLAHRQYCIESLQERQRTRIAMELGIHTYYPQRKERQLAAIGAVDATASRFPTIAEMHKKQNLAENGAAQRREEEAETERLLKELRDVDEVGWSAQRAQKGERAERIRELPYLIDRPHVRHADLKPPHLPVRLHDVVEEQSSPRPNVHQ